METNAWNTENPMNSFMSSSFYQLLRLLNQMRKQIKIVSQNDLAFPIVDAIVLEITEDLIIVQQNIFSLIGNNGILPDHYSLHLQMQIDLKDYGLKDFLDIFNHAYIMQYYNAWACSEYYIEYEKCHSLSACNDYTIQVSRALLGFSTKFQEVIQELFLYHAGIMINLVKTRSGLKAILIHFFALPIEIEEFSGAWIIVSDKIQSRLSSSYQFNQLGQNFILGCRTWSIQHTFKVIIGPIDYHEFLHFIYDLKKMAILNQIVQCYSGAELNFITELQIYYPTIPYCILNSNCNQHFQLGLNMWLKTKIQPDRTVSVVFPKKSIVGGPHESSCN